MTKLFIGRITEHGYDEPLDVVLDIRLKTTDKGLTLAISGDVWEPHHKDIVMGGQINDELRTAIKEHRFKSNFSDDDINRILDAWDRYHLNDMRAGCEHQRAWKWNEIKLDDSKPLTQDNMAMWSSYGPKKQLTYGNHRFESHPRGLLSYPCPICGYRYGTAWLYEALPDDVVTFIKRITGVK